MGGSVFILFRDSLRGHRVGKCRCVCFCVLEVLSLSMGGRSTNTVSERGCVKGNGIRTFIFPGTDMDGVIFVQRWDGYPASELGGPGRTAANHKRHNFDHFRVRFGDCGCFVWASPRLCTRTPKHILTASWHTFEVGASSFGHRVALFFVIHHLWGDFVKSVVGSQFLLGWFLGLPWQKKL